MEYIAHKICHNSFLEKLAFRSILNIFDKRETIKSQNAYSSDMDVSNIIIKMQAVCYIYTQICF